MSKFDVELQKILLEQNLIDENWFTDGVNHIGNKIKHAGKAIADTGKKVLNWSIDKIQSFFQKLWEQFTPDNAEETAAKAKSIISKIPGDTGKQLKKTVQISQSNEYKNYLNKRLIETYQTKQKFQALTVQQQKDFTKKCANEYIKQNNIISESIISEGIIIFTVCIVVITICSWVFKNTWFKTKAQQATDDKKEQAKQAEIQRQEQIKQNEHQKCLDQQQRKQLFQLVAQSNYFN